MTAIRAVSDEDAQVQPQRSRARGTRGRARSARGHGSDARPLTCAQPGQAGPDAQPPALAVRVAASTCTWIVGRGPTSDISPAQDVDQVRQLVDRRAPQQRADPRDPRVALVDGHPGAHVLGAGDHRAQLVDLERVPVEADAALAVDRVPAALEPDRERRERDDRRASATSSAPATARSSARLRRECRYGGSPRALRRVPAGRRAVAQPVVQAGGERGGGQDVVAGDERRAWPALARERRGDQRGLRGGRGR